MSPQSKIHKESSLELEKTTSGRAVMRERRPSNTSTPRPSKPAPTPHSASKTMTSSMAREFLEMRAAESSRVQLLAQKPKLPTSPSPRRSLPPTLETQQMAAAAVAAAKMQMASKPPPPPGAPSTPRPPPPSEAAASGPVATPRLPPPPPPMSLDDEPLEADRLLAKKVEVLELEVENLQKRLQLKEDYVVSLKRVHERSEKQLQEKLDEALRTIKILQAVNHLTQQ